MLTNPSILTQPPTATTSSGIDPRQAETLVELLSQRAAAHGARHAIIFLRDGDGAEVPMTYADLDRRARALAAEFQRRGLQGERAVLLYKPGLEYVVAFFGCLYAGLVAVPVFAPRPNASLQRLQGILTDAGAAALLTSRRIFDGLPERSLDNRDRHGAGWLCTDEVPETAAQAWEAPSIGANTLAFLQYTSGSTSIPKGVKLTHGNLLHNLELIRHHGQFTEQDCGVFWLPPYHDMGLIGGILLALYGGFKTVLISPVTALMRPIRWLQAIDRYRGTLSASPNFAFELCLNKIRPQQLEDLDLSSWRAAFNGAEPIRADTVERFTRYFEPCGLRPETMLPCYGLAEASLFVSGCAADAPPLIQSFDKQALSTGEAIRVATDDDSTVRLVACGRANEAQTVCIVDPDTGVSCAPGKVGEIWVASPSVARGYWKRTEQTAATFGARLADAPDGQYMRTGDLGFVLDGQLYVAGRIKELIIIRGENHYPQELEYAAAKCDPSLRTDAGAAFSMDQNGEERLILLQEVERGACRNADFDALIAVIRQAVSREYELRAHAVGLLKPGTIPKTSSGKIQRGACRQRYLDGEFEFLAHG